MLFSRRSVCLLSKRPHENDTTWGQQNMSKQYLGRDFGSADGTDSDKINPGMLNTLAEVFTAVCLIHL